MPGGGDRRQSAGALPARRAFLGTAGFGLAAAVIYGMAAGAVFGISGTPYLGPALYAAIPVAAAMFVVDRLRGCCPD